MISLLPVRTEERDLVIALTAGDRTVTLLDFHDGAVWKRKLDVIEAHCGASRSTEEPGVCQLVLGKESGLIMLYQLSLELTNDHKTQKCVISMLESWNLEGGDVILDSLSFGKSSIVASCSGSVYLLREGGAVACVTNTVVNVPSKTLILSEKLDYLVNTTIDGNVHIFNDKNQTIFTFNVLEISNCPSDVLFSFKESKELLRKVRKVI